MRRNRVQGDALIKEQKIYKFLTRSYLKKTLCLNLLLRCGDNLDQSHCFYIELILYIYIDDKNIQNMIVY